eukprot:CAMPEP_0203712244 /NCGR_PEP_ID=MMETSP0091-20130426/69938_1 /ASSEMBLY_ACC=CAM_ASM_001089 /TAXON_ID=426623 /ORGANISM="Chaetoceros affinis, Strain CCMP159" /LENGTH=204 /DNA_ID=CAMNT_0050590215 /DNA_START=875 /DNA_END=1485 /DNA_ORIENTATION=+
MIKSIDRMIQDSDPRDSYDYKRGLHLQPLLRHDTTSSFSYQLSNYLFYQYSPLGLMLQAFPQEPSLFDLVVPSTWIPYYPSDLSIPSQQEQVEVGLLTGANVDSVGNADRDALGDNVIEAVGFDVGAGVDSVGNADRDALGNSVLETVGVDVGAGIDAVGADVEGSIHALAGTTTRDDPDGLSHISTQVAPPVFSKNSTSTDTW